MFRKAEAGIGKRFWSVDGDRSGHIKDLERALFAQATELKIKIENKRFIRLHQDATLPGVVVVDDKGIEEIVVADYVFDCTGPRREVINAVNLISPNAPFKMATITELPVTNHFLAYIKISASQWGSIDEASNFSIGIDTLSYARSIIKLRNLGWNEFKLPRCYGESFGKDKVCVYLHAPDYLAEENYDIWVQTVLESYSTPVHYEHLKPSEKYKSKPRFMAFTSHAQFMQHVSHKGEGLPTVIALGDAQIDFDYAQAHGILDGMSRIDALFKHIEIINGEICYFDPDEYLATIETHLRQHKRDVAEAATRLKHEFFEALELAKLQFLLAAKSTSDVVEKNDFTSILKEIDARQAYANARKIFVELHDVASQIKFTLSTIDVVVLKLDTLHTNLLRVLSDLPINFGRERRDAKGLVIYLAASWKEIGNALFKSNRLSEAVDAYKKAIEIYNLSDFKGKYVVDELPLYSNLVIVYNNQQRYSEAIAAANTALDVYKLCPLNFKPILLEKIVFNLIKALCAEAQEILLSQKNGDANLIFLQAKNLVAIHEVNLSSPNYLQVKTIVEELEQQLVVIDDIEHPSSIGEEQVDLIEPDSSERRKGRRENIAALHTTGIFAPPRQHTSALKPIFDCCILL